MTCPVCHIKENPEAFHIYIKNKRVTKKVKSLKNQQENLCLESEHVGEILNENFAIVFTM